MLRKILSKWFSRYLPAEIIAFSIGFSSGFLCYSLSQNRILTAFVAAWAENISYYIYFILKDISSERKNRTSLGFSNIIRNIILEFGPGEYFDSAIVRPFFMYYIPILIGSIGYGLIVAKFISDFVFYIPTITIRFMLEKHGTKKKSLLK